MKNIKIGCFKDKNFKALEDYNADDIEKLLSDKNISFKYFSNNGLEHLTRDNIDILIIPYITGNFSPKALDSLIKFHAFRKIPAKRIRIRFKNYK